jgi:hypothetical protein
MIKSKTFFFKTCLIVTGFLLLVIAFFLPFESSCLLNDDESLIFIVKIGLEVNLVYFISLLSIAIFVSGYFYTDTLNKVLTYSLIGFLSGFIIYNTFLKPIAIGIAGGFEPCDIGHEIGYWFSFIGSLFVSIATFISVYRNLE